MPRNMSFMLTTRQFKDKSKTVTRRVGWWFLKPGDIVMGCEKCQGLKKGEKVNRLGLIRIVSTRKEPLEAIMANPVDVIREGFPEWRLTPGRFVEMFCKHNKCNSGKVVNRIEFEYL